MDIQKQVGRQ